MRHALIIDDNMIVSSEVENRLCRLGYTSFEHAWTEDLAVAAAARRFPDLVIVGDNVETGSAINAARRISTERDVPVLLVTGDMFKAKSQLRQADSFSGPFGLGDIGHAVMLARKSA